MTKETEKYIGLINDYVKNSYRNNLREPKGSLKHPFLVPGAYYAYEMWDWDSWLTDIALYDIAGEDDISQYGKGTVLNFLEHADGEGRIPINVIADRASIFDLVPGKQANIHKPCLAQHALFITRRNGNDAEWLREGFPAIRNYLRWYDENAYHAESGLYVWINDFAMGIDNDPCVFYRPDKSTASVFLNCLMYEELCAASELSSLLGEEEGSAEYAGKAEALKECIRRECWDERDGFYYSADVNLKPLDPNEWLHSGSPRHWHSLPMRISVWGGFLSLWNGIATKEQAERIVKEHYRNPKSFCAPYGVRSLSRQEKMYLVKKSGNPSCWLGPVWGNVNYFVFCGLLRYGYREDARSLAEKTVTLFGRDIERCGQMHEYYDPDTGEGVNNQGFQSWNLLVYPMAQWLKENG